MNRKMAIGCSLFVAGGLLIAGVWAMSRVPPVEPPPKPVPLSRVVQYYEEQLEPEIPKITVTAVQGGETFGLPYDAAFVEEKAEESPDSKTPKKWFLELMNNFWSLPALKHNVFPENNPAIFSVGFEKQPDSEVTITNYWIYEYGTTLEYSTREGWDNHSRTFVPSNRSISFALWDYAWEVRLSSNPPPLLGLRMQCSYGTEQVEYYILFQNADPRAGFAEDFDFSHLTPLEGLEEE
ncbi:MAG: hypothetical protein ACOX6U_08750 [Oscillospiraceae bacterium]